jgi:hypothetical protein
LMPLLVRLRTDRQEELVERVLESRSLQEIVDWLKAAEQNRGGLRRPESSGYAGPGRLFAPCNGGKIITTSGRGMLTSEDKTCIERARFLSQQARDPVPHTTSTRLSAAGSSKSWQNGSSAGGRFSTPTAGRGRPPNAVELLIVISILRNLLGEELEACSRRGRLPKAVVPTDLYGQCVDLDRILDLCNPFGVPVEVDAAERWEW